MISQERLVILAVVFTMALGVSLTLSPAVALPYGLALAVLAAVSVPYLLHTHPGYVFSPIRLILPATIALEAPSMAHLLGNGSLVVVGVFGPAALLYATIYAEYQIVRPSVGDRAQTARLLLTLTAYAVSLAGFVLIYGAKERSLISGTVVGIMSGLLALRLLSLDRRRDWHTSLYAFIAGLAMAELWWPMNYWTLNATSGGVALLLCFYLLTGPLRQLLTARVSWRLLAEYGSVGVTGALLVAMASRAG